MALWNKDGYFFDAITRLNLLIDDPGIKQLHQSALDYLLTNSTDHGYGASKWQWPNAVIGRGLLADYSATSDPQQKEALAALIQKTVLHHANPYGRDGINAEEALYLYAITGNPELLAFANNAYANYVGPDSFCSPEKIDAPAPIHMHGVTTAETLKIIALNYLYTGNDEALQLTKKAYDKVVADSLMPDGGMVSSENMGPSIFSSIHESCDITDWSWSIGACLMATGDAKWADLIERTIFNALPGATTKDFKQAQYFSAVNQVISTSLSSHGPYASTRMSYRAAHDTECCVGNINRAMPNYVIRQWMKIPANNSDTSPNPGIAAILYGPSELSTTINDHPITITQQTDYPFRETITFKIQTTHPINFTLHLRIPGWCQAAKVTINNKPFTGKTEAGSFAQISRTFKNNDIIRLTLPMQVRLEEWFEGKSVVLVRGPLVYALQIDEKSVEITKDTPSVEKKLQGNLIQGFPAIEFYPQSEWRYGIDPTLKTNLHQIKVIESRMTANPFLPGHAPVHLELPLRHLPNWQPAWNAEPTPLPNGDLVAVKTPTALPLPEEQQDPSPATPQKMVPYGATHLRLTTLPIIQS